jgi:hypothetical protein
MERIEVMRRRVTLAVLVLPTGLLLNACGSGAGDQPRPSTAREKESGALIVTFLGKAQLQIETDTQRAELNRALQDIATLSPKELASKRYADYAGHPNQWTALQILRAYYYSPSPPPPSDAVLYAELNNSAVRSAITRFANEAAANLGAH